MGWGLNQLGQCTVPSPNADFVAVAAGGYHSLGLKSDGTIVAWGRNLDGECNVPSPNAGFVAVAAGHFFSVGLRSNRTIVAWGSNEDGACILPSPNSDFVAIAAGTAHGLGLKADSTIVAWGWNGDGQCDVPEPNAGFGAIAAGYAHSLGLRPHPSNAGGMLVVHDTGLAYTSDGPIPPSSPIPSCEAVVNEIPLEAERVWKVYAVFPWSASPRLKALAWGLYPSTNGGGGIRILGQGLPDPLHDSEVTQDGWPDSWGCGVYESFHITKTAHVVECY